MLKELADFDLTEPEPSFTTVPDEQLAHYIGDYQSSGEHYAYKIRKWSAHRVYKDLVTKAPAIKLRLKALDDALWLGHNEEGIDVMKLRFLNPDNQGKYTNLFRTRINQRVS